jgi:hypothetical protein
MGILTWIFRPSGLTHGGPPFLLSKSSQSGTHGTKPHQKSLSARQVNLGLENPNFLVLVKLPSALFYLE